MGKKERAKGARGERQLAEFIRGHGFDASRSARNGKTDEDITHAIPGIHIECKRVERLSIPAWIRQAERDAQEGYQPVVVFRQSGQPWRAVVDMGFFLELLASYHQVECVSEEDRVQLQAGKAI